MRSLRPAALSLALALPLLVSAAEVKGLRTEHLEKPLGVDNPNPRFSWYLEDSRQGAFQSSFQVLVASDSLKFNENLCWDSGIREGKAVLCTYAGSPLQPFTVYWWKVICTDDRGVKTCSEITSFETGVLLERNWRGNWISDSNDKYFHPAPRFRKEFQARGQIVKARAYVSVAGLYSMQINGKKVGDRVLDPAFTRYDRRGLYTTYDITSLLMTGSNAIGVTLGNGWYNHQPITTWHFERAPWRARPAFCMDIRIEYADGSEEIICTDNSWKTDCSGPYTYNNVYTGERIDARKADMWTSAGYDDSQWTDVVLRQCPSAKISSQTMTPIRESAEMDAVKVIQLRPNKWIFDFGANMAGNVHLHIQGPRGTTVTLKYSERLSVEQRADQSNIDVYYFGDKETEPFQTDVFTLSGELDDFCQEFSYKGFRYVELTSSSTLKMGIENLKAVRVNSDVTQAGSLIGSNETMNAIEEAARWSYLSNLMGYPTDCPQREKNGWTGDGHLAIETGLYNYDAFTVYEKWLADHRDEQQHNGVLPDIIPTCGWGYWNPSSNGNGLDWTSTIALIPWELYLFYGDDKPLRDCYDNIVRYVEYALTLTEDGLSNWGRGDWVPVTSRSNKTLVCSCFLYKDLCILSEAARMFGHIEDALKYSGIATDVRNAINRKFLNTNTGIYAEGMQTDLSLPMFFGVTPEEFRPKVGAALADRVARDGFHINAGVHGTKAVLNVLSECGNQEIAWKIATAKDFPSWGWWLTNGHTTLIENWRLDAQKDNSDNHIMFGDVAAWFYRYIGGIQVDPAKPAFQHIVLKPYFPKNMNEFSCHHDSPYGRISSSWVRSKRSVEYTVTIPCSCSATFSKPDGSSEELSSGTHKFIFK